LHYIQFAVRHSVKQLFLILVLMASATASGAAPASTQPIHLATNTVLHDQHDRPVTPLDLPKDHRAVVLIFILTDCPISNSYAPAIADLCRTFTSQGIDFFTVYEDSPLTPTAASAHHDAYGFPCDALLDSHQQLARITGATVTSEAIVVGPGGTLLYRGRIDDQYVAVGKKRFAATTHELKDVLSQIAADQPVIVSSMPAVGCAIP
jgi:peroxiredoxin